MTAHPETIGQAQRFDRWVRAYLAAGLCTVCAARAGWVHQLGASQVQAPCTDCLPIVAALPVSAAGQWRKLSSATIPVRGEAA